MTKPPSRVNLATETLGRQGLYEPPPLAASPRQAAGMDAFLLRGGLIDASFTRRNDTLLVTFDNLASVGQYDPPQPWLMQIAARLGLSILGIMASQKDWYRNADTPQLIRDLSDAGFFAGFRRVVFVGASMGGYAALAYSKLVAGAAVLAFSPQSTLHRGIAPFEKRFPYGERRWDWVTPEFLDAAACVTPRTEAYLAYDPFEVEDRAHAKRFSGAGIRHIYLPHMGHRAIRKVKDYGGLTEFIGAVANGRFDLEAFARIMRARRQDLHWQRELFAEAGRRGHDALALAAARRLLALNPEGKFAQRLFARLARGQSEPPQVAVVDEVIHIAAGSPKAPFTGEIQRLGAALVVPERKGGGKLASGVLKSDGSYVDLSRGWIRAGKSTSLPELLPEEAITDLPGRHLFAGHFRGHFGHFLVEATARLWAMDHLSEKPESILYMPYRGAHAVTEKAIAAQQGTFELLGIDIPIRCHAGVLRVEELLVPELGFGWKKRYAGSPAYRNFMRDRLSQAAEAEGGAKLYISRAKLAASRGGIFGEEVIEQNLVRAGFEVFHPERHPLATQIARYKAAKIVVALDGSALHLAAYVLSPQARVAIILRRTSANVADYLLQYRSFLGITPDVIDVIRCDWISGDNTRADFRSVGELDFSALFGQLAALGHLPEGFRAELPSPKEIAAIMDIQSGRRGDILRATQRGAHVPGSAET